MSGGEEKKKSAEAIDLISSESLIPSIIQGELVNIFSTYSAMSVLDREHLNKQYEELLLSGVYKA